RARGDFADLARCAVHVATLADGIPAFAMTLPGAGKDSALVSVLRSGVKLRRVAEALGRAAEARDGAAVGRALVSFPEWMTTLDANAPKQYVCPMHCQPGMVYD